MPRPAYRYVLFDFDGTLATFSGDHRAMALGLWRAIGEPHDAEAFMSAWRMACIAPHGPDHGVMSLHSAIQHVAKQFGVTDVDAAHLSEQYISEYVKYIQPVPGMIDILVRLRQAGSRIAIVTNGPNTIQRAAISAAGVEFHVDAILVSGDVSVSAWKPSSRIFERALERLRTVAVDADTVQALIENVPTTVPGHGRFVSQLRAFDEDPEFGEGAVMVGDSVVADLHGARAARLHAIGFGLPEDAAWSGPRAADAQELARLLFKGNPTVV
jgi:FMN phosphatase YigB (HAD superfamily)